jgi:hypothetical protein
MNKSKHSSWFEKKIVAWYFITIKTFCVMSRSNVWLSVVTRKILFYFIAHYEDKDYETNESILSAPVFKFFFWHWQKLKNLNVLCG